MNITIKPYNAIIDKPSKYKLEFQLDNKYELKIPNICMSLPKTQHYEDMWSFDIICEYRGYQNKYELWFESLDYDYCKETNKFVPNEEYYVFTPHHNITQNDNKIIWYSNSCDSDIKNKYHLEIGNKPFCIYSGKENRWTLCLSFIADDIKESYEIWRVQDFDDLGKEDIIYKKITDKPEESLEETQELADKHIEH